MLSEIIVCVVEYLCFLLQCLLSIDSVFIVQVWSRHNLLWYQPEHQWIWFEHVPYTLHLCSHRNSCQADNLLLSQHHWTEEVPSRHPVTDRNLHRLKSLHSQRLEPVAFTLSGNESKTQENEYVLLRCNCASKKSNNNYRENNHFITQRLCREFIWCIFAQKQDTDFKIQNMSTQVDMKDTNILTCCNI